jgi:plasmid stabilization system protein ParE
MSAALSRCRAHPTQCHVIYYRIGHNEIEIVRILHERSDPTRQFPERG